MKGCPSCESERVVKNGHIHNGKQRYKCRACGRQYVLNPTKKVISYETRRLVERLLLEKLPLAAIARASQVSESWLQSYVNQKYQEVARRAAVPVKKGRL